MLTILRLLIIGSLFATSSVQLHSAAARKGAVSGKKAKQAQAEILKEARAKLLKQAEKECWSNEQFVLAWGKVLSDLGLA